jgi:hypothetical protein
MPMPVKRRLSKGRPYRITPEAVEVWVKLTEIIEAGDDEEFEPVGRRNEYVDALTTLHLTMGIRPWQESPVYAVTAEAPAYMRKSPEAVEDWRNAWELRCELEEAASR